MKTAGLKYRTGNVGDEIQSLAADRIVGAIDKRFNREKLAVEDSKEKYNIVLNGWFSQNQESSFPPKSFFNPVFYSFHIYRGRKNVEFYTQKKNIDYFKNHEPIGCRDMNTLKILKKHGVDAFYSRCLTMTFPKREHEPVKEKIFFVDAPLAKEILPDSMANIPYEMIEQGVEYTGDKIVKTQKLLDAYKNEATLVVTTRLHCALPCVAMGIPVILFFDPKDKRMETVKSIGLKIYKDRTIYPKIMNFIFHKLGVLKQFLDWDQRRNLKKLQKKKSINWSPEVLDIEDIKKEIIGGLKKRITAKFN